MNKAHIGQKLYALRKDRNLTLRAVAADLGLTFQAIWNYEKYGRIPKDDVKVKIADYYGVTVQSIFFDP